MAVRIFEGSPGGIGVVAEQVFPERGAKVPVDELQFNLIVGSQAERVAVTNDGPVYAHEKLISDRFPNKELPVDGLSQEERYARLAQVVEQLFPGKEITILLNS